MYLDSESKTRLTSLNADRPFAESVRRKTERTNKMKKLMIAAAAVAMVGGAFAEVNPCTEPCPFGYQIKIYLKTTDAGSLSNKTDCTELCLRKPAVKRFAGFIYGTTGEETVTCGEGGCECNDWSAAELVMWNYDTKAEAVPATAKLALLDRIYNGDTTTAEICFTLDKMAYAGFGRVAKRNGKWTLKYASGFGAGMLAQKCTTCTEMTCGECTGTEDADVKVWAICASESAAPTLCAPYTAAYGKWTIDWSSTIYNRLLNKQQVVQPGASWQIATPVLFEQADTFAGACE